MKVKKVLAVLMTLVLMFTFVGCGKKSTTADNTATATPAATKVTAAASAGAADWSYSSIKLGEDYTDTTATIKFYHNMTNRDSTSGGDGSLQGYIAEFNKEYPNITVTTESEATFAEDSLLRLSTGDWGDVMFIPAVDKDELPTYFVPYGTTDEMSQVINYSNAQAYDSTVYGIPMDATANGIVYNKAVFEKAGITAIPTTPDEFIADLKLINDKTDAIPLYTNYAAKWTMGAWDAYVGSVSTGDYTFMNQKFVYTTNPFSNPGDGTGAYNVYKILYDAVAQDLIEDDYTTTDWEGCKAMINNGQIGTMVLGSWAYSQMVEAGDHGADIGYMPFPISVNGKQYAVAGANYSYGININSSDINKLASTIFVKWMTEKSGWYVQEGGLPTSKTAEYPDLYKAFENCTMQEDASALPGEETLFNDMNTESELMINSGGNDKVMDIVVSADTGDKSFDDIMNEWNQKWTDAQASLGVEVKY
jgi:raffinose/stachyose/melibiose transport system substrate-binding protein